MYIEELLDASYQASVHLAKRFQRRILKCKNVKDDKRRTPSDAKSSPLLWKCELKGSIISHLTKFNLAYGIF